MKLFTILSALLISSAAFGAQRIRVINEKGQPISGAQVIIGNSIGNKDLTTDVNGYFVIPDDWKSLQSLSIQAPNYITTSFLHMEPREAEIQLHSKDSKEYFEVKGQVKDFEGIVKDGKVDVGLVYPAMTRRDLLQFDMSSVISPETDEISVITEKVGIPSNVSLPKQTETYIFPINLDKPQFRMFVRKPGTYRLTATHAQFPLRRVIEDIKDGKSVFQVLNHFRFRSAGQMEVDVSKNMDGQNLSVNKIKFDASLNVIAPPLNEREGIVSAALINQEGLFFPSDLKGLKSGETVTLHLPRESASKASVLSLLTNEPKDDALKEIRDALDNFNRYRWPQFFAQFFDLGNELIYKKRSHAELSGISLCLQQASETVHPQFLSLVEPPEIISENQISLTPPAIEKGINPIATYLILSEIEKTGGDKKFSAEKRFRVWEAFEPGWAQEVVLPKLNIKLEPKKTLPLGSYVPRTKIRFFRYTSLLFRWNHTCLSYKPGPSVV